MEGKEREGRRGREGEGVMEGREEELEEDTHIYGVRGETGVAIPFLTNQTPEQCTPSTCELATQDEIVCYSRSSVNG